VPYYLGIDPGTQGAACRLSEEADEVHIMRFSKLTYHEIAAEIDDCSADRAMLEKVGAMPKQGVATTFKFGHAAGLAEGLLIAHRIPYECVTPAKWQREFVVPSPKASKARRKKMLKEAAQALFPSVTITNESADAVLIAEYCRRVHLRQLRKA
jgi:crossover junction endodeoxyribonuclease RuvC